MKSQGVGVESLLAFNCEGVFYKNTPYFFPKEQYYQRLLCGFQKGSLEETLLFAKAPFQGEILCEGETSELKLRHVLCSAAAGNAV